MTSNFKCSFEALNDLKTYFDVNNQNFSMDHEKSVVRGMNESLIKFYFLSVHTNDDSFIFYDIINM